MLYFRIFHICIWKWFLLLIQSYPSMRLDLKKGIDIDRNVIFVLFCRNFLILFKIVCYTVPIFWCGGEVVSRGCYRDVITMLITVDPFVCRGQINTFSLSVKQAAGPFDKTHVNICFILIFFWLFSWELKNWKINVFSFTFFIQLQKILENVSRSFILGWIYSCCENIKNKSVQYLKDILLYKNKIL